MRLRATVLTLALTLFALPGCHTFHAHHHDEVDEAHAVADGHCHGVLSCTADAVGYVVLLPFRIVGSVIDWIF
jgi:hypothetical protein